MYCRKCGGEINPNSHICMQCGERDWEHYPQQDRWEPYVNDTPSMGANIASCCFPIVGLVLYLVWKDEKPERAKNVCYWTIGGLVFSVLVFLLGACAGAVA